MVSAVHPQQMVYRSALARALAAVDAAPLLDSTALVARRWIPGGTSDPAAAAAEWRGSGVRALQDTAMSRGVPGGLHARGLVFLPATGRLPFQSPLRPGSAHRFRCRLQLLSRL